MLTVVLTLSTLAILTLALVALARRRPGKFPLTVRRTWVMVHVFFVLIYFAGAAGLGLVHIQATRHATGDMMPFLLELMESFDYALIIPAAFGCFLSGVWLSLRAGWGLSKHGWIIAKWGGNLLIVTLGILLVGNMLSEAMLPLFAETDQAADAVLASPAYLSANRRLFVGHFVCAGLILVLTGLSYFKPKFSGAKKKKDPA